MIPGDGEVIEGVASVDESAITGESAPVIRESGGDRSAVTGGTRVLSDWLDRPHQREPRRGLPRPDDRHGRGRQAAEDAERDRAQHPAGGLHDHLPARHRHPAALLASTASSAAGQGTPVTVTVLVALLVCLIPTTIGGLLSAIGIAGMDRMHQANVIAMSGRAVEAAGRRGRAAARQDGHDHARQPAGHRVPPGVRRRPSGTWPTPPSSPRWPTRPPRGGASWCSPRRSTAIRERDVQDPGRHVRGLHRPDADERREPERAPGPQGRRRRDRGVRPGARRRLPAAVRDDGGQRRQAGRDAARRGRRRARARGDPAQGHRQGRHPGALRRAPPDGDQDHHDHRRQPAHRGGHRGRGGRGRLPGPGDARGEAEADPRATRRAAGWWR